MQKTLAIIPYISEKAYASSLDGVYIFSVPTDANKAEVIRTVQAKYGVTVNNVNLLIRKGKKVRQIRFGGSRGRLPLGTRSDRKFAYVTVKKGDVIQVEAFQEVQAEQAVKTSSAKPKKEAKK